MSGNRIYVIDGLSKGPIDGIDKNKIINIGNTNKSGIPTLSQVLESGNLADRSIRWQNSIISPFVYGGNDVLSTYQSLGGNGSGIVFHTNYFDLYSKKTVNIEGIDNTYNSFIYSKQTGSTVIGLSSITQETKKDVVIDLNREFGIIVVDELNQKGLVGFEYFGGNYEDNSYVQKYYVDEQIKKTTISDWSEDVIYDKGVIVSHNGGVWRSEVENNNYEPEYCSVSNNNILDPSKIIEIRSTTSYTIPAGNYITTNTENCGVIIGLPIIKPYELIIYLEDDLSPGFDPCRPYVGYNSHVVLFDERKLRTMTFNCSDLSSVSNLITHYYLIKSIDGTIYRIDQNVCDLASPPYLIEYSDSWEITEPMQLDKIWLPQSDELEDLITMLDFNGQYIFENAIIQEMNRYDDLGGIGVSAEVGEFVGVFGDGGIIIINVDTEISEDTIPSVFLGQIESSVIAITITNNVINTYNYDEMCGHLLSISSQFNIPYIISDENNVYKLVSCPFTEFPPKPCGWKLLSEINDNDNFMILNGENSITEDWSIKAQNNAHLRFHNNPFGGAYLEISEIDGDTGFYNSFYAGIDYVGGDNYYGGYSFGNNYIGGYTLYDPDNEYYSNWSINVPYGNNSSLMLPITNDRTETIAISVNNTYADEYGNVDLPIINDWDDGSTYSVGNIVSHNGGIWRSLVDGNNSEPDKLCGQGNWEITEDIIIQPYPHFDSGFQYEIGMFLFDSIGIIDDNDPVTLVKLDSSFAGGDFSGSLSDVRDEFSDGKLYGLLDLTNYLNQDCEELFDTYDEVYIRIARGGDDKDLPVFSTYQLTSCPIQEIKGSCDWTLLAEVNEEFIETNGIDEVLANGDLAINKNFMSKLNIDDPQTITPFAVYYDTSEIVNSTTQTKAGQYVVQKEPNGYVNVYNGLPSRASSTNITSITYFGYRSAYGFTLDDMPGNPTSWFGLYAGAFAGFSIKGNNNNFIGARAGRNLVNVTNTTLIGSYGGTSSETFNNNIIISDGTTAVSGIGFRVLADGTTTTPRQTLTAYNNDSTNKAVVTKEILTSVISGLDTGSFATQTWVSGNYINKTEKGSANGVATLDSNGKILVTQLPNIAISETFVINSEASQIALTAQTGDVAVRTDIKKSFIHNGGTSGTISDWTELLTPTDSVLSVNGMTGSVTIGLTTLDDAPNNYTGANGKFVSVNSGGDGIEFRGITGGDLNMGSGADIYVPSMIPNSGVWNRLIVSTSNTIDSLALRTSTGTIRVSEATHDNDAVNLSQLNSALESNKMVWDSEEW